MPDISPYASRNPSGDPIPSPHPCFEARINASPDSPNHFKEAYLHAELWRNEGTGEELWALVALREGWRVPEETIEEAVWSRVAPRNTTDEIVLEKPDHPYEF